MPLNTAAADNTAVQDKGPRPVREIEHCWIPLPDGCRLAARIWLPEDAAEDPVPALFEYLPYRKRDATAERDEGMHPRMAAQGYACVRVDIRGNGDSDGLMEDEYTKSELDDGVRVIKWIADQPWCSGSVGMVGISWGGFNGLQIAALQPEALKAIITICSTDDRYADDIHYMGGCLLNDNLTWSSQMLGYSSRPADPALVGEGWRETWLRRLENMPLLAANWLAHQRRDEFWQHGSVCEDYSDIKIPVYAVGGWADAYTNAVPRMLSNLPGPREGLIGPWVHKYPQIAFPEPSLDFLPDMQRWWDRHLKGEMAADACFAPLRAYIMNSVKPAADYAERPGRWVGLSNWPLPDGCERQYYLTEAGLADAPELPSDLKLSSPQNTGMAGGRFCPGMRLDMEMPTDQRGDDALGLSFDADTLAEDLEILGAPILDLEVAADRPQALIAVRLCDVHPDGSSTRISVGVLNLTHRDSHEFPEPLTPGRKYRVRVQLNDTGYRVSTGHKLRLSLSSCYWPLVWPSPEKTELDVTIGTACLTLPDLKGLGEELDLPRAVACGGADVETLREPGSERYVETEIRSGETVLATREDFGRKILKSSGIEMESTVEERYSILPDDPLSARVKTKWMHKIGRGDWRTRTLSWSEMWSDLENFHLTARLEAYENGELIFEKNWSETIPRDQM